MSEWIVENKWFCKSCGAENLGRHMSCQTCSAPKDESTKDEPADPNAPPVTDPKLLEQANQEPNWVCEFCKGQVRDASGKCRNCSAPKPKSEPAKPLPTRVPGPGRVYKPKFPSGDVWLLAAGTVLLFLTTGTGIWYCVPHEVKATISRTHWVHTAVLEQRSVQHQEGWGLAGDAFNIACVSKFYGNEDCNPYDCNQHTVSYKCRCTSYDCHCTKVCKNKKNGYSSCRDSCNTCTKCDICTRTEYDTCYHQCPVYKQWCNYDRYVWNQTDTKTTLGEDPHEVYWPELEAQGPDQRVMKTALYQIQFTEGEKQWEITTSFLDIFQHYTKGDRYKLKVNGSGKVDAVLEKIE